VFLQDQYFTGENVVHGGRVTVRGQVAVTQEGESISDLMPLRVIPQSPH
jgi:hypothetical protein